MISLYLNILISPVAYAQTPTRVPSKTPTPEPKNQVEEKLSDLKDRIASRVAQLKLVERRGVMGTVTEVSDTQITLSDIGGTTRFVDVDELTKFSSPSAKGSFGISDITKGQKVGILGLYNKQSRRILARFVDVIKTPTVIHGAVSSVDKENFTIQVVTEKSEVITVDIENITQTKSYTKETGLVKAGFSKILVDQRIIVIGFPDVKEKNRIVASRVIVFPTIPKNPAIILPQAAALPEKSQTIPSTGSGKKLTPLTR